MQKGLVSVLTPCYNGERLISRLLDSLLQQDYPDMEIIIVDDGSTDNTKDIVYFYKQKFEAKGISLNYIYQDNGGQSAAINNGLKYVNGEYLVWPDCDDWYNNSKAISSFVYELKKLPNEYAEVRCIPTYVSDKSLKPISNPIFKEEYLEPCQFGKCLYSDGFIWAPGNYILRMEAFDNVNPQREIYVEKNAGQNWQMHLPVLFSHKVHTIKDSLHNVLVRAESHSRGQYKTYEQKKAKIRAYENTVIGTLERIKEMPENEKRCYKEKINSKYEYERFLLALSCREYSDALKLRKSLKTEQLKIVNALDRIVFWGGSNYVSLILLNEIMRVVRLIRSGLSRVILFVK